MWKTVLFDLDGTLTDSGEGIMKSFAYAVEKGFGIRVEDYHTLKKYIGQPLAESFQEFAGLDEEQAKEAVRLYRERYVPVGIYENRPYDGIPELLSELRAHGFTLVVASSKPTVMCEEVLRHFGLRQYFALVVGSELDGRRTHKDEVIAEILKLLGMEERKEEAVLVGDSPFDVKGAKAAGIDALSVAYGYGERKELEALWPACIVDTVGELRNVLIGQALYGLPSEDSSSANASRPGAAAAGAERPEPAAANAGRGAGQDSAPWRSQPVPVVLSAYPSQGAPHTENGCPQPAPYAPLYAPSYGQPVPYDRMVWPYAQSPRNAALGNAAGEEEKPRRMGYRKSRDGHPFLAFWRVIWPPLAAFFIMELVGVVIGVLLMIWTMLANHGTADSSVLEQMVYTYTAQITIIADACAFILVFFLYRADENKRKRFRWDDRILKKTPNWVAGLFVAVLAGILGCIFFNWLLSIFNVVALDPAYEKMQEEIITHSDPGMMIIGTVIVAPIFEDLLFRGILYRRLRDYLNVPLAILLSAAAFGVFHGNIIQFFYATALGILFAILYEHYGTILVPILCHLGANLASEILNYLVPEIWSQGIEPYVTILLSGLLLAALMFLVLRKKNRVNRL